MSTKTEVAAQPEPSTVLFDNDVAAPDALDLDTTVKNAATLVAWIGSVALYVETMQNLNRAVLLKLDGGTFRFSSIEDTV